MNQSETRRGVSICPTCGQVGQRITCMSGNKYEIIMYHPGKIVRTICNVIVEGTSANGDETTKEEDEKDHENDTIEIR